MEQKRANEAEERLRLQAQVGRKYTASRCTYLLRHSRAYTYICDTAHVVTCWCKLWQWVWGEVCEMCILLEYCEWGVYACYCVNCALHQMINDVRQGKEIQALLNYSTHQLSDLTSSIHSLVSSSPYLPLSPLSSLIPIILASPHSLSVHPPCYLFQHEERRVALLENRLSELSETVGNYDRQREGDQQAILWVKLCTVFLAFCASMQLRLSVSFIVS